MANVNATRQLTSYTDDFGRTYTNLPFKISEFYANNPAFQGQWSDRQAAIPCSPGSLFTTRRLVVTFLRNDDVAGIVYERIQMPVATRAAVLPTVQALLQQANVICIDYEGERWTSLPGSFLPQGVSFNPLATIEVGLSATKVSGTISYEAEYSGGTVTTSYRIERFPESVSDTFVQCVDDFTVNALCSDAADITTRRLIVKARKFFDGEVRPGTVVRSVPISRESSSDILTCLALVAPIVVCAGYEGEKVKNVQNLILAGGGQPLLP